MSREDQYNVTVSVSHDGETHDLGTWDKLDGGEMDSDEAKYFPGGMEHQISLGGRQSVGNVTVSRLYDLSRDHPLTGWLMHAVGCGDVTVVKDSLTCDAHSVGHALVYKGKLKSVTPPPHDSESGDAALIEMEISSSSVHQQTT